MLAAAVEILLAAGDLENARAGAAELSEIAGAFDAPLLSAASAHATGAVLLAEGDVAGAATVAAPRVGNLAESRDAVRRGAYLPADGDRL